MGSLDEKCLNVVNLGEGCLGEVVGLQDVGCLGAGKEMEMEKEVLSGRVMGKGRGRQ